MKFLFGSPNKLRCMRSVWVMRLRCLVYLKSENICVCVCVRLSPFVRKFMTILMDEINAIEKNYEHSK